MRFSGMPLEKIALVMNSSQVSGKGQFRQAIKLTFQDGALAPYRVVGAASLTAWFLQYSGEYDVVHQCSAGCFLFLFHCSNQP